MQTSFDSTMPRCCVHLILKRRIVLCESKIPRPTECLRLNGETDSDELENEQQADKARQRATEKHSAPNRLSPPLPTIVVAPTK
jgi:hypothetical protein